ncbi:MAG: transposase [Opitutaceae bacterium]|nr:transposase [Opitutaceae bacterium]
MNVLPQRRKLPHEVPAWVRAGATYFITICGQPRGFDRFCRQPIAKSLFEAVAFRQRTKCWYVHLLLLMPDHLHALVSFSQEESMAKVISGFKEITAKLAGIHWQRDFFDHRLRSDESFEEKASYIRMNPVRTGLVENPEDWPWQWEPTDGGPGGPALPET